MQKKPLGTDPRKCSFNWCFCISGEKAGGSRRRCISRARKIVEEMKWVHRVSFHRLKCGNRVHERIMDQCGILTYMFYGGRGPQRPTRSPQFHRRPLMHSRACVPWENLIISHLPDDLRPLQTAREPWKLAKHTQESLDKQFLWRLLHIQIVPATHIIFTAQI
jgi:hypothetical protein